jgi:peptidoglycan/xylan/chitin deacetylase (PgdA/CDA1 family)
VADPQLLCVTPQRFAEQLSVLRDRFRVVPLQHLVKRLNHGDDIENMVAISFDDGYADNLLLAKPLLERYEVPATVFIASDYIGGEVTFWWDELESILLGSAGLPQKLRLEIDGQLFFWDLGEDCLYGGLEPPLGQWHVECGTLPSRRHRIYQALHQVLYTMPAEKRDNLIGKLRAWSGCTQQPGESHRTMTHSELNSLAQCPLVEIGAHTASHPALSMLPLDQQEAEIRNGKARLEEMIGRQTTSFAYPYGSLTSFNDTTSRLVQASGFSLACTTFTDSVRAGCDSFQLPRLPARNWNGEEFERYLNSWATH